MDFKTTTRLNRHSSRLEQARALLAGHDPTKTLRILEVGPGLAVRYFGRAPQPATVLGFLLGRVEMVLRRLPMPDSCYENYETSELLQTFAGWPTQLTLMDINPRVLRIVRNSHEPERFETQTADISDPDPSALAWLAGTFDLIVALSSVGRIRSREGRRVAAGRLRAMTKPGGLILINDADISAPDCKKIEGFSDFYRTLAGQRS